MASQSIARNSAIILVETLDQAVELANRFAPEHLSIPDEKLLAKVRHAGSVFCSSEAVPSSNLVRSAGRLGSAAVSRSSIS